MKILFIYVNPIGRTTIPPNLSMLIGNLKAKRPYEVALFDTSFYKFDFGKPVIPAAWTMGYFIPAERKVKLLQCNGDVTEDLIAKIGSFAPDLIATSCYSNQRGIVKGMLTRVRREFPHIPVLVGGCYTSFEPNEVIAEPWLDMICVGEGEDALIELCDRIYAKKDYSDVKNIWLKKDGKIVKNAVRQPVCLDDLGDPDWDIFDPAHIYQPFHGSYFRVGMVEFGRGCPYFCTYCANHKYLELYKDYKSQYFRHRNPRKFVERLKLLKKKYALEIIYFQEGTFLTMRDEVLEELAELYEKEIGLPCIIITTVPSINDRRLKALSQMKCIYINLGIEEGNPEFREKVLKRKMSNQQIVHAFQLLKKYGIYSAAYNVIGFPHENRADIFKSIELNRQCDPDSVYPQIFYPIEGSELRDLCIKEGFFDPALDSLHTQILSVGQVSILKGLTLSREEIHGLSRTFYLYVRSPKILYPFIRLLEKDTPFSRLVIGVMTRYYWRKDPYFRGIKDLVYKKR